jgi:ATP:ADP antiporter, AAA family
LDLSAGGIKEAGIIAIVLSALWLANSLWLGKRQEVLAEQQACRAEQC